MSSQKNEIIIFSFVSNTKFPIDLQIKCFKKYIKEKHTFFIVNDADNSKDRKAICEISMLNGVKYILVPSSIHNTNNPSEYFAETLNWILHHKTNNHKINMFVHCDIFPICNLSIVNLLGNNSIASTFDSRRSNGYQIDYFCPVIVVIDKHLKNKKNLFFDCCNGNNVITINHNENILKFVADTGGKSYYYMKNNPDVKIKTIQTFETRNMINVNKFNLSNHVQNIMNDYIVRENKIINKYNINSGWLTEDGFYHYLAGSQWNVNVINKLNYLKYDLHHSDDNIRKINAANLIKKWYGVQKKRNKNIGIMRRNILFMNLFVPALS